MSKIWQIVITLLIEKGYKLTKEVIFKLIADFKARKRVKECIEHESPQDKAKCLSDELNNK